MNRWGQLIIAGCFLLSSVAAFGAGGDMGKGTEPLTDGSEAYPYLIEDIDDFDVFCDDVDGVIYWDEGVHTRLMATLDIGARERVYDSTVVKCPGEYQGYFDGNHKRINDLVVRGDDAGDTQVGFFRAVGSGGTVDHLELNDVRIDGGDYSHYIGGLCGINYGTIRRCVVVGTVSGVDSVGGVCGTNEGLIELSQGVVECEGVRSVGGLVGWNNGTILKSTTSGTVRSVEGNPGSQPMSYGGLCGSQTDTIEECNSSSRVEGIYYVGGLVGIHYEGVILNSFAEGNVMGYLNGYGQDYASRDYVGGLCGGIGGGSSYRLIEGCFSSGMVTGGGYVGGLCGEGERIVNCSSSSPVSGVREVGGLCGVGRMIVDSSATGRVSGQSHVGGLCGEGFDMQRCYATGVVQGLTGVGGLCGVAGHVSECYATGQVNGVYSVGGFCGYGQGDFVACYASGMVSGEMYVGGFSGIIYQGNARACKASGRVIGDEFVGGFIGGGDSWEESCYATGDVFGVSKVGGFAGEAGSSIFCYAIGLVIGDEAVGGFGGYRDGWPEHCFWDMETSGVEIGLPGMSDGSTLIGKTTSELQVKETFTAEEWAFIGDEPGREPAWRMPYNGGYPMLYWEKDITGDVTGEYGVDMADFALMTSLWGAYNNGVCDLNDDWRVNMKDLVILAGNWLAGK